MNDIFENLLAAAVVLGLMYIGYDQHKVSKTPQADEPAADTLARDYKYLYDRIEAAKSESELKWCVSQAFEFERKHKSRASDARELFIALLAQAQAQANVLYIRQKQQAQ